jgi:protein SCO1
MPKLRTISRSIVLILVVVVGVLIGLHALLAGGHASAGGRTSPKLLAGTALDSRPAPLFALRDQSGALISLSTLRGRPVVLTFLDAICTTECPLTAQYLDWTGHFLGARASGVAWLALSVNPANTPAQAQAFIATNQVSVPLHVLLGTQAQLAPLWKAYFIQVIPQPGGDTAHTIVTYLIDRQGHEREVLDQAYDAKLAAQDLRALLAAP